MRGGFREAAAGYSVLSDVLLFYFGCAKICEAVKQILLKGAKQGLSCFAKGCAYWFSYVILPWQRVILSLVPPPSDTSEVCSAFLLFSLFWRMHDWQ